MIEAHTGILQSKPIRARAVALAGFAAAMLVLATSPAAQAVVPGPSWSIVSQSEPTFFKAGDTNDAYRLIVRNSGATATAKGVPVTITDTLPAGVTATKITAQGEGQAWTRFPECKLATVECTYPDSAATGVMPPGDNIVVTITVSVSGSGPLTNSATVTGGGAPSTTVSETTTLSGNAVPFGLSYYRTDATDKGGNPDTQAGSHPFELVTSLAYNISGRETPSLFNAESENPLTDFAAKDLEAKLPPGIVGNPNAVPRCSQQSFLFQEKLNCPLDTQVGTVKPFFYGAFASATFPVFNIEPPSGQPAELGFTIAGIGHVPMFFHVRSDGDYGLTAQLRGLPTPGPFQGAILTLWGVPADHSHDLEREGTQGQVTEPGVEVEFVCKPSITVSGGVEKQEGCRSGIDPRPFLTLPTSCPGQSLPVAVLTDSWQQPEAAPFTFVEPEQEAIAARTGCQALAFTPSLAVRPDEAQAGAPSGYTVNLHIPQSEDPNGLATPDLKAAVVTLPAGTVISPSAANGLQACTDAQFGLHSLGEVGCSKQSKIGTVTVNTPLLTEPLEGDLFLGSPGCSPCGPGEAQSGQMVRLFLLAQGSGVTIKLAGRTLINQSTGQLTAVFDEDPQLPFEDLTVRLHGGDRAPLANPSSCSVPLIATSQLTSYSGAAHAQPSSAPFEVNGCPAAQFNPSFLAGTVNNQAGAFSPETVTFSRSDADQDLGSIAVHTPPGLLGLMSRVAQCPEPQAQAGTCAAQSEIGTTTVGAGPGSSPLFTSGKVYLTGPYKGAPFGLSIVVPAVAGPLNLGTVIVRAAINVDPTTAALTIAGDPLPQSLDGIPLHIRTVNVNINREGFIFNPTSCQPLAITGAITSTQDALAPVSSRFQAANCATLPFKPRFTVATLAKTSKPNGAALHVKVVSGAGQANIARVKVDLPKQLPSRLTTLQKACLAAVFEVNPAGCPAASVVGNATAITPVLSSHLTGPAYLVSHGGAAFPDLEIVLQGEGITLVLDGKTKIEKGITTSSFNSVPDAPIASFDLMLPQGPHSVLGANLPAKAKASMCGQTLNMPTAITGQNGAVVKQTTKVSVTGCPKHKAKKKKQKGKKAGARRGRGTGRRR